MKNHENYKQVTYLNLLPFLPRPPAAARGHPCSCGWPSPEAALRGDDMAVNAEQGGILESLEPATASCISPFCFPGIHLVTECAVPELDQHHSHCVQLDNCPMMVKGGSHKQSSPHWTDLSSGHSKDLGVHVKR